MSATAAARLEASTASPQPHRRSATPAAELSWDELAVRVPQMAATMQAYLDQLTVSSRPGTVVAASLSLRHLAAHVADNDPTCTTVAAIERRHIESYKLALAARPGRRGNTKVSNQTIRHNLGMVRTFFERVIDWDYPDAPRRVPVFTGDLPKADEPTPKFLDDPTAAKFMATLATDSNRRRRLIVELLARTGMRAGELGALRDDAMYRLGDTHWLRIPSASSTTTAQCHCIHCSWDSSTTTEAGEDRPRLVYSSSVTITSRSTGAPSTATSKPSPNTPASATYTHINSATPSPHNA